MVAEIVYNTLKTIVPCVIGDLPSIEATGCGLIEIEGSSSLNFFGTSESIHRPLLRVLIRSNTSEQGLNYIKLVTDALNKKQISEDALMCILVHEPTYLGRTANSLYEWQLTFQFYNTIGE
jgi:hypothetical protein